MEQGDFIVQLLDLCEEELLKPISDVVPSRLQSLFELALRTSTGKHDPYKEDMTLTILTRNNTHQILTIQKISGEEGETLHAFIPFTFFLVRAYLVLNPPFRSKMFYVKSRRTLLGKIKSINNETMT